MKLLPLTVLACALGWVSAQDAYTQGAVQGATLALAGTAVLGLGVIAVKQHQRGRRNRYRNYQPYYGNYYGGYQGGYQQQGYNGYQQQSYQPQGYHAYIQPYRRRRSAAAPAVDEVEADFEKVRAQDAGHCGMRVVCELQARAAAGEALSEYGQLIISLFGTKPAPVPARALDTAHGRYGYAAYIGATSDVATCASLYSSCQFSSDAVLQAVQAAAVEKTEQKAQ